MRRGDNVGRRTTAANPFHGQGPPQPLVPLLGVPNEPLQLSAHETVYLMHAERALSLGADHTLDDAWNHYIVVQPRFAVLYYVYHHYRQLGYVVRSGGKFAGDWVLYEDQPGRCHAKYSVMVQDAVAEPNMTWPELLGVGRVAENVCKDLIWCRVRLVRGSPADVVSKTTHEELLYERWSPHQTRDDDE